eukprot:scaffold19.g1779.t1
MPLYALMIAAPRARITRRVLGSPLFYLSAAALYATLLVAWRHLLSPVWEAAAAGAAAAAAGALPDVAAFAALFARPAVTAVAWVHLLLLDLWVWEDGVSWGVPVGHSAVLCFMAAPLGLLSHLATKAATASLRVHAPPLAARPALRAHARRAAVTAHAYQIKFITPDGSEHTVPCEPDAYILDAVSLWGGTAEEAGVDIPYGCRQAGDGIRRGGGVGSGTCHSCCSKLESGKVDQADQNVLEQADMDAGYLMLCVSTPLSDCVIRTEQEFPGLY